MASPAAPVGATLASPASVAPSQYHRQQQQQQQQATATPPVSTPDRASHALHSKNPLKPGVSPRYENIQLTGVAALAEQKRHEQETAAAAMTSPNPAAVADYSPFSTHQPMSRPTDAPTAGSITQNSMVDEPMEIDRPSASTAIRDDKTNGIPQVKTTRPSEHEHLSPRTTDDHTNKAVTYPPPPKTYDDSTPARNNSVPTPGSANRSSSTKKHKCPDCKNEFTRHHNLKSHLLTHSQEKPYACTSCGAKFRRLHDLKRHTKLHTGERPHTCSKCGRKFARGDALARHSKGPGGCAGRRGSGAGEDEDGDETMEGISYAEDTPDANRRKSESNRHRKSTVSQHDSSPSLSHSYSTTFPGQRTASNAQGSYNSNMQSPSLLSPSSANPPSGTYFTHQPQSSSSYAHGSMTESPRPLSPGSAAQKRASQSDGSFPRARSPSLTTKMQQSHFGRDSHGGAGAPSLPPPMTNAVTGHAQLPPLHASMSGISAPQGLNTHAVPAPPASNPGSVSSHQQSSVGSMRDILNNEGPTSSSTIAPEVQFFEQVRHLNAENRKLQEDVERVKKEASISEQHYETKIRRLEDEIKSLRQQLR